MERDFKGIRIPKEIRLDEDLNIMMKVLLVEIDSLDNEDGCFASNSYFSEFFGISETQISIYIKKLKELGYIEEVGFDGRKRYLRSRIKEKLKSDSKKTFGQHLRKVKGRVKEKLKHNNIDNNINNNTIVNSATSSNTDTNTQSNTKDVDVKKKTPKKKRTTHSYTKEFEEFWKIYPHARKSKKSDAKKFFKDQDSAEVLKEATLLRYKIEFGIEDSRYLPACERWIRDFVPSADVVVIDNLKKIMKLVAEMPVGEKRSKIVKDFSESYGKSVVDKVFKDVNSKRLQTIER